MVNNLAGGSRNREFERNTTPTVLLSYVYDYCHVAVKVRYLLLSSLLHHALTRQRTEDGQSLNATGGDHHPGASFSCRPHHHHILNFTNHH